MLELYAHLSKGLDLIGTLPDSSARTEEELAFRIAIGGPLIATKGYPSPEVERTYSRAWALCEQLGRSAELFPVLRGLWSCNFARGELERAFDLAKRLVLVAEEQEPALRRALAGRTLGPALFSLGRITEASEQLDQSVALDGAAERPHNLLHGELPGLW